ncbi:MAG TPA: Gfo/Idh/MocA family oxidoreductase [Planctomycetota bacterium]|nr:Gfo/Idh/MocA family oxidoreductase [Planctomycetota bacterium]
MQDVRSRREFLRRAMICLGAAVPFGAGTILRSGEAPARKRSANERLRIGVIGAGGRGGENLQGVQSEDIVAICDVDRNVLANGGKAFPGARTYEDFRRVLDHKDLDAVVISTPDHMHAIPAAAALRAGLDVYCEKPLAHSVHEVRTLRELTAKERRVTQMGTQIHAGDNYRRVVEAVKGGVVGPVRRVHVWMDGRPQLGKRAVDSTPPSHINYDLWLGPAPYRPYHPSSFHFTWRHWWDFGNSVLGDFGCHYMDLPFWALDLHAPLTVEAVGKKDHDGDNDVPGLLRADYHFPARGSLPPVHLTWYHGGWKPPGAEVYKRGSAVLFEGDRGRIVADYGSRDVYMDTGLDAPAMPAASIPESIGHHREWIEAVKTRGPTTCDFEYSGELTEAVLLGNAAYRSGKKLEWDALALKAPNAPEANPFLRREYRAGWTL